MLVLLGTASSPSANQDLTPAAVEDMNLAEVKTLPSMGTALNQLKASANRATAAKPPNFDLQEALVTASGEAVGRIFSLYQTSTQSADLREQSEALFLSNRELLRHVLKQNERLIRHYQEYELDKMKNPAKFFESAAWQSPQQLISLASYWLGWNGYYASLLMSPEASLRKTMLEESVEAFSRSFIDFQEDEITAKSLYGRGLVYKQLEIYGRAAYDFKSVKQKVGREHPLYLNCLYQEAVISHESGNNKVATALLKAIRTNYVREDIPSAIQLGMKQLEAQMIVTAGDKSPKAQQTAAASSVSGKTAMDSGDTRADFQRLKAVAKDDADLFGQFYKYSKEHAAELANLSYQELTPVAALAVADWYFEAKDFDSALLHYQKLLADKPAVIKSQADGIRLRTAYIHNHRQQWSQVTRYLKSFSANFPNSHYLKEVAELYYSAAVNQYRNTLSQPDYQAYIAATRNYVTYCGECALRDDAHYELGRHYSKEGQLAQSVAEYAKVGRQSSHYYVARYHVADAQVSALESFSRRGGLGEQQQAADRYNAVRLILKDYDSGGAQNAAAKPLRPNWALLRARFELLSVGSNQPDYRAVIAVLEAFETRYPDLVALKRQVRRTRVEAFQRLGEAQNLENEIARMAQLAIKDRHYYQDLQVLADRFYTDSTGSSVQPVNGTMKTVDTALMLYQRLASVSRENQEYQPYLQAIQLRLGDLLRRAQRLPEALDLYRELAATDAESAHALYALGHIYLEMAQWKNALDIWRQLSDGLESGSSRWYEARYQMAYTMQQLKRPGRACSLAKMTLVLHPDLGNEKLTQKLQTIERETCRK